jgi:short subunit dehydrogenase-like uncharacterized protein
VTAYFRMYGGLNGGTVASLLQGHETGEHVARTTPFVLNPDESFTETKQRAASDVQRVRYEPAIDAWVGPFFMAPINTRIVRRSAGLFCEFGQPYGSTFSYQEYLKYEPPLARLKAEMVSRGMALFATGLDRPRLRSCLERFLPKPGEGPSEATIRKGWFRCELLGTSDDGHRVRGLIAHAGDPSNSATTEFVAEAALTLALDSDELPGGRARGGVLTPATALGEPFAARVRGAGTRIEIGQ